ncbi:MAG: xanthine dehydrogenase family protein subunit M [Chloroflexota bacterium]|nr:xanthine dehydrogenase family protein subunit M [Chloroflexota bacterium]
MFPAKFEYYAPTTVNQVVALLKKHKDAKVLAGGHSLLPTMKLRLAQPSVLVDIGKVKGLSGIKVAKSGTTIGATTTHAMIAASDAMRQQCPALPEAAALIGDLQVRNRGTIGGSLSHADPAADYPAVMLALGAEMKVVGPKGARTIKASDWFKDLMTTALKANEVLTEIHIPPHQPHSGCAYVKFPNPASRFAIVGVCAWIALDDKGNCAKASIGITGACATASHARKTEAALQGKELNDETIAAAAAKAADGMDCMSDIHASAEYRAHLVAVMTTRAVTEAVARAK